MVDGGQNSEEMTYVSTRGEAASSSFETVLLSGLAPDGGLYMPSSWPRRSSLPPSLLGNYAAAAAHVMAPYTTGSVDHAELFALASEAYAEFDHPGIAPLVEIGPDFFLLELFHGPTLAFKDFAMQVLSRLMERALRRNGTRTTILGATSGDTGAAAVEAFRGREDIELFILYPDGRISDVQRKQMTTAREENIHPIAVDGTFDDAQFIVKTLFGDADFRARHDLSAINSINWARIIAQTVYYYTATAKLSTAVLPSFSVPTGNFGDIFAGFAASKMGCGIGRLVIATNENDILARALATGRYEPRSVHATDSPSMDIQVSSNFERLLFEESGRDASFVRFAMQRLRDDGAFDIPPATLAGIRERFSAHRIGGDEAAAAMHRLLEEAGVLVDPHTAVGLAAAQREREHLPGPMVVLGTAHPAKFPDAVRRATGRTPEIPERLRRCLGHPEQFERLPNCPAAVANYIDGKASKSIRKHS
jgi:threonine synthase